MSPLQKGEVGQRDMSAQSSLSMSPHSIPKYTNASTSIQSCFTELLPLPRCTVIISRFRILLSVFHFSHVRGLIKLVTVTEMLTSMGKQIPNFEEISEESFLENSQFVGLGFPGAHRKSL